MGVSIIVRPGMWLSVAAAVALTTLAWIQVLTTPGFIMHGDLAFPIHFKNLVYNFYPMWSQHPSMSNIDEVDRLSVAIPILWVFEKLHLESGMFSLLTAFFFALLGSVGVVVSKRLMERHFFADVRGESWSRVVSDLIAVIVFTLNPRALYLVEAPFYQLAYSALPLFVALQIEYLYTGGVLALIGAAILWTLASGSPQYTIFLGVFSAAFFLVSLRGVTAATLRLALVRYVAMLALYVVLNLYWIGTFFDISKIEVVSPGYILRWSDVVGFSSNSTFFNVIAGTDDWVTWWTQFNPMAHGLFNSVAAVLRTTAFLLSVAIALVFWRRRFMKFALASIALLVVLLQGAHGPISPLYHVAVVHIISGFGWIIREPGKFGPFLWFFYALVLGTGTWLLTRTAGARLAFATYLGVAALLLIGYLPILNATLFGRYVPIQMPESYLRLWDKLKNTDAKLLVVADYENLSQYTSGDAVFTWAPRNAASAVIPKSIVLPTFGVYHFTNPMSYFYSFVKAAGPDRLQTYAAILGTRYVLLERDVVGDEAWFQFWRSHMLAHGATLVEQNEDFALFEYSGTATSETRTGSYAVLVGDAGAVNGLADKFGAALGKRILILLEQGLPGSDTLLRDARVIILDHRSLQDAVADSFSADRYVALYPHVYNEGISDNWSFFKLANRFEEQGSYWNIWQRLGLGLPTTWSQDLGLGIVATTKKGARLIIERSIKTLGDVDVYVRYFDFVGPYRPEFEARWNGGHKTVRGTDRYPTWEWMYLGRVRGQPSLRISFTAIGGCPALNVVLLAPHDAVPNATIAFRKRSGARVTTLADSRLLKLWPEAQLKGGSGLPNAPVVARESLMLDEAYDQLWQANNREATLRSYPTWIFANGFTPVSGPTTLSFLLQTSVERWWRVERYLLAVVIFALAFLATRRALKRRPSQEFV